MAEIKIKYLHLYTDVRGKQRCYFNRRGWRKISLPLPHEPNFMPIYLEALNSEKPPVKGSPLHIQAGSFASLIRSYRSSDGYTVLRPVTKRTYDRFLNNLENSFGHIPINEFTQKRVNQIRNTKKATPDQANRVLSIMRLLFRHAVVNDLIDHDPTTHLKKLKSEVKGFLTWSENDIHQFTERWPLGTNEHLALQCLLQTAQRRSDIIGFSFEMIDRGAISLNQSKTGVLVTVPILPDLQKALDLLNYDTGPILRTDAGIGFTVAGFGNFFRDAVYAANLRGLSAHGLRKAMCVRLADAGCTPHEIMAVSGHLTLSEVTRYTINANKRKLAKQATDRLLNQ